MEQNGAKRARTVGVGADLPGREQLLLASPELQTCLGRKFCDDNELLGLLLARGMVRRVKTIGVEVYPLGGNSFKVRMKASKAFVGEAKLEISRVQGTAVDQQELYRVAVRADGGCVREDDADAELLGDDNEALEDSAMLTIAVKEKPLLWRTFASDHVLLSEDGNLASHKGNDENVLTTSGIEISEGRHYWEVESRADDETPCLRVGVCKPNLDPLDGFCDGNSSDGWCIDSLGALCGNGENADWGPLERVDENVNGDRVGVLLDLNNGSLLFFKNGVQDGPGYPAGSVIGPVTHAIQTFYAGERGRMIGDAAWPAGHTP
jgi:hypothetical protein